MSQGIGWLIVIGIWLVFGIALTAGAVFLQIFLSKKKNKFLGLILPILALPNLIQSILLIDVMGIQSLLMSLAQQAVLLGIYFIYKKKQQ